MDWLSWIFPRRCVGCGRLGDYLCAECINHFQPLSDLYCPVCRKASFNGQTHPHCHRRVEIDGLVSCYRYQGMMKRIIAKYKYKFVADLNKTIIELLISDIKSPLLFQQTWSLVPVPLHPHRLRWRGFNQAELIAEGLSAAWGWPVIPHLLTRTRPTSSQMTLSGTARRNNLQHAFKVTPGLLLPRSVMLVDDVATSCSTLRECATVLKKAGVNRVWGLTLAQAVPG